MIVTLTLETEDGRRISREMAVTEDGALPDGIDLFIEGLVDELIKQ